MKTLATLLVACAGWSLSTLAIYGQSTTRLAIQVDAVVAPVSPTFSGMMTEEINHSYDGGLYGELVRNRSFKDDAKTPRHWSLVQAPGAVGSLTLDPHGGMNAQLPAGLTLAVKQASPQARVGLANEGYWGFPVQPKTTYRASFYASLGDDFSGPLRVSLESPDGQEIYAQVTLKSVQGGWVKNTVELTTGRSVKPTTAARLVLSVDHPGRITFSLVSLFPPTWHDRPNGNRVDLMQSLADMRPTFLRFPGGNFLEGDRIANRFPWQATLGDITTRPGHPGCWGYYSTDGLGLLEFLEWAEDLKAQPVLAVYAGYSLPPKGEFVKPGPDLAPYVTDALDEIEYVIGGPETKWGARRIADGHPAPFPLKYVEIGNEDWFDESGTYDGRFTQFYDAIKAKYPQLQLISTVGNEQPATKRVHSRTPDLVDEHYYRKAADFIHEAPERFEQYDRHGPKIFVGEWAAYEQVEPWKEPADKRSPTPSYRAALGDAAWLLAMERNSDIVLMQCYAPMLVNVNPGARQWRPNLIGYDALHHYGSPSYHVISLFNAYTGTEVVRAQMTGAKSPVQYSVTRDAQAGWLYVKLLNPSPQAQTVTLDIAGVKSVANKATTAVIAATSLEAENSLAEPTKVAPVTQKISGVSPSFSRTLAPYSVSVFKIHIH
ncbi:MAG TPA: alpha-L-arabinofuranosidase C-terminal domain-containing protein [Verrucomicrobiae bacterium]